MRNDNDNGRPPFSLPLSGRAWRNRGQRLGEICMLVFCSLLKVEITYSLVSTSEFINQFKPQTASNPTTEITINAQHNEAIDKCECGKKEKKIQFLPTSRGLSSVLSQSCSIHRESEEHEHNHTHKLTYGNHAGIVLAQRRRKHQFQPGIVNDRTQVLSGHCRLPIALRAYWIVVMGFHQKEAVLCGLKRIAGIRWERESLCELYANYTWIHGSGRET